MPKPCLWSKCDFDSLLQLPYITTSCVIIAPVSNEKKRKRLRSGASSGVRKRGRSLARQSGANATVCIVTVGQTLSERYELVREISRTELGVLYEAVDHTLDGLKVAIKVLPPELSASPKAQKRMRKEAVATLQLAHPNILRLYSFERDGTNVYIVTEFLDGPTMAEVLTENPTIPLSDVLELARDLCSALDYAHKAGVIHRDVRPENIVWVQEGKVRRARLTEFGVARQLHDAMTTLTGQAEPSSLLFVPPEQLRGKETDGRTDQYSLAVILYELLSVPPLFEDENIEERIINEAPKPIEGLTEELNEALLKALSKDPAERYERCADLLQALEEAAKGEKLEASKADRGSPPPLPKTQPQKATKPAAKPAAVKPAAKPVTKPLAKMPGKAAAGTQTLSEMIEDKKTQPKADFHSLAGTERNGEISFVQRRVYQFMRVMSTVFDNLVLSLLLSPVFCVAGLYESEMNAYDKHAFAAFVICFYYIHNIFKDGCGGSASFGKRIAGLRTITSDKEPCSFTRSFFRNFIPYGFFFGLAFTFVIAGERIDQNLTSLYGLLYTLEALLLTLFCSTRRMGDLAAGTRVVYDRGLPDDKRADFSLGCFGTLVYIGFLFVSAFIGAVIVMA